MHLKLDVIGVWEAGINKHPQEVMKDLGIKYQVATPQSIADAWWFWNCINIPDELPSYLSELKLKAETCIGWGLSAQEASAISKYEE